MHLVVLGAFGPAIAGMAIQFNQVLMHLVVLGAFRHVRLCHRCSPPGVLMHLVVLGAFYPSYWGVDE